jgi:hypothetical protein
MKLDNLKRTLETCRDFHEEKGNETRVKQIEEHIKKVSINHLENDTKTNGLYLGQSKNNEL